jgi:calcineurin-like phosphoesterase family protein
VAASLLGALVFVVSTLAGAPASATPPSGSPMNASPPTIGGTLQVGQTLTGSAGKWNGERPLTYVYQWQRCPTSPCASIANVGSNSTSYMLVVADMNSFIRLSVTARNSVGSASATSSVKGPVAAAPAPTPSPTPPPTSPPPTGGDPVIAAAGDIACDPANGNFNAGYGTSANCRQKYTSDLLLNSGLSGVLLLGDNQYDCGGYKAFLQSYDLSWGRVKGITHPAVGNHEYTTSGTDCDPHDQAAGYYQYFGNAAGQLGQGYYSYDIGTWHIIALNSNCTDAGGCSSSTPQGQWLTNDLKTHSNQCVLAYWHIPLFSSGGRASSNSQSFWNTLYAYGADVILNGHDHIYERFAPQNATGSEDNSRGVREFIVGTGGANHTSLAKVAANSQIHDTTTYGVLRLTLHAASYDWWFARDTASGTFADSGSASCH